MAEDPTPQSHESPLANRTIPGHGLSRLNTPEFGKPLLRRRDAKETVPPLAH